MSGSAGGRLVFANQLRGLAALSVAFSHLGGVFVLMRPTVGWITSTPGLDIGHPAVTSLAQWAWLNYGALGVSVFFLISGFVIPFSLRSSTAMPFLLARLFRIVPLFWFALFIEWLVVFTQAHAYGRPMAYRPVNYLYDALMIDDAMDSGSVDLVHWTLIVEVKFYLAAAVLRSALLRGATLPLLAVSLASLCLSAAQSHGLAPVSGDVADEVMFIGYMLIGTVFHLRYARLIGTAKALATGAALLALFLLCWRLGPRQAQFPLIPANYLYGLAIFAAAYLGRGLFRPLRWLDLLADISFPFYLTHSIVGYSVMTFAILRLGLSYGAAAGIGLAVVLLLAWVLHKTVELPSLRLGKKLAARLAARYGQLAAA